MRTTLKRGVGRGAGLNGNGRTRLPPAPPPTVTRYVQPPPPRRTGLQLFRRILVGVLLAALSLAAGIGGGSYLYFHQSVSAVRAHSVAVKRAQGSLDEVPSASAPATALVIGYDHRAGTLAQGDPSLSDTLMLIRADPTNKTISMLSFPRDLEVPIYCGHSKTDTEGYVVSSRDRINSAYSRCGPQGTVLTIKHLTNLPLNYLITVNFHGFKEVVNKLGGVWMDIDRRYYNKNIAGYESTNYANINLQPGYQRLNGQQALDFVRFRHTDSDLVRNARQQEFVRSFKEQVSSNFSLTKVPGLVSAITKNIEVGEGGGRPLSGDQVLSYALFAFRLPHGHLFQDQIENVQCDITCTASPTDVANAIQQFTSPNVDSSKEANAAALGKKVKPKTPPPSAVSVTVLNGNGQAGAAANASYLLAERGYKTMIPPNNLVADAPSKVFHTKIYYDPAQASAKEAAQAMAQLVEPADVAPLPASPALRTLDPGSMLLVVLGTTFDGTVGTPVVHTVPTHQMPSVRSDTYYGRQLLDPLKAKVPFPLETPTVLEKSSVPDTQVGDVPARLYTIAGHHKAIRLVFRTGLIGQYWGIEETDWNDAPALNDKSFRHDLGGREFDLYYNGPHLQMVVLRANGATYWVVNTLSDTLSNETMLAIAKGLKPLEAASK
jgi:LCP family protein required for cell wall assembly